MRKIPFLPKEQNDWLVDYQKTTGFEPLGLNELVHHRARFDEIARLNIKWFENWMNETYASISEPTYDETLLTPAAPGAKNTPVS